MRWITQIAIIATALTAAGLRLDPLRTSRVSEVSARKSRSKDLTTDHLLPVVPGDLRRGEHG
jgi:hypothetical protein